MKMILAATVVALSFFAQARTLAWYRFEEALPGTATTGGSVFTNSVDASKYPAYPRVSTANGNNKFDPARPMVLTTANADRMPIYTNAFPANVYLYDQVGPLGNPLVRHANARAVDLRNLPGDKNNPSGLILVDDHADLRPKSLTLEFFMRSNDATEGFRTLAVRTGRAYGLTEAFRLYGNLYPGGAMFLVGTIQTRRVTQTQEETIEKYTINASHTEAIVDDNRWHHIALVVDNAKKTAMIYVDYVKRGSVSFEGEIAYDEGYPFAFGADPQCSYYNMFMALDEIRLSDEALAPERFLRYGARPDLPGRDAPDAGTLFFFDFDGSQTPVRPGAGEMAVTASAIPFLANKASHPETSHLDAEAFVPNGTNVTPLGRDDADLPQTGVRFGLLGAQTTENLAACSIVTNSPGSDQSQKIVLPLSVTGDYLFGDSLTAELYFRLPAKRTPKDPIVAGNATAHLMCLYGVFGVELVASDSWAYGMIRAMIANRYLTNNGQWNAHPDYASISYADGRWHHLAFVYDKDAKAAYLYVDRVLRLSLDDVQTPFYNKTNAGYLQHFIVGGSFWPANYFVNLRVDDVRLTRGALRPYQFLTTVPFEPAADYASASFEQSLALTPYDEAVGAAGAGHVFASGGKLPAFAADRPSALVTAGRGGAAAVDPNRTALRLEGGAITYPGRALVAHSETFTVQFFAKMKEIRAGAGLARVNRGSETALSSAVTWALSFADADGNLSLKVDTDKAAGQVRTFAAALSPGVWHHLALQFAVEDGHSVISLYRDYALVGTWTATGTILARPRLMNFMLGAGEDPAAGFDGWIDELRVTPGLVPVEEFLFPKNRGLIFWMR